MADKTGEEICRICDGGPGNNGMCLCGEQAYYTPTPGDLSEVVRKAEAMIRGTEAEHMAVDAEASLSLGAYLRAALSALPAAGGAVTEWRWVDERGRAMTNWKQGDPPPMTAVSDTKGTMRVEVRTTPQPSAAEGRCTQYRPGAPCPVPDSCREIGCSAVERELFAAVGAQGEASKIADEIMRLVQHGPTVDWRPNMAEIAEKVRRLAAPAAGKGVDFDAWHDAKWPEPEIYHHKVSWRWDKDKRREAWQAALTRQPVAGDGEKYRELLLAVAQKYPGESRHETALRYIRERESASLTPTGPAQGDGEDEHAR